MSEFETRTEVKVSYLGDKKVFLEVQKWVYPKGEDMFLLLADSDYDSISLDEARRLRKRLDAVIAKAEVKELA